VRQLARVLERALALSTSSIITVADLPDHIAHDDGSGPQGVGDGDASLRSWSSRYVRLVLERCDGNKRRACDVLDITYHTLQSHLAYGTELEGRTRGRRRRAGGVEGEVPRPRAAACGLERR
jgi:transcriptional regulator with PAS, ATPase and Fis domain